MLKNHRYMREDIAFGLAFLVSIAEWAGVQVPVASGLLSLASVVVAEHLRESGRTLKNLDLHHFTRSEMKLLLDRGVLR